MPVPSILRAVIFDLDGTLTDSRRGILGCLERALRAHDIAWEGSLAWFIGPPAGQSFARLMPDRQPAFRTQVLQHYRACYAATGWTENAVYPGIRELLTTLGERGVTLYLCTSKRDDFTRRILDHFGLSPFFVGIASDNGTSETHDKADLLAELMDKHGIQHSSAVMVGDREFDILAARTVGLPSIAVLYGFGAAEELAAARPDATCASVAALTDFLLARTSGADAERANSPSHRRADRLRIDKIGGKRSFA
jgi:phosphoglycolate phosphatase